MKKRLPKFKSDKALTEFVERDLSDYIDRDNLSRVTFEFAPKSKVVNLRISEGLLSAVKALSKRRGMPYQRFIRETLEQSVKRNGTKG